MANINGFTNFQNERGAGPPMSMAGLENTGLPLVDHRPLGKNPRDENLWDMCRFSLCRSFTLKSSIFVISIIYVVLWIISLIFSDHISGRFLSPSGSALLNMGAKDNYRVQNYQIHRLVLSNFLHGSFMHVFTSVVSLYVFGFPLERKIGWMRLLFIHQVCSIAGTIFSSLISDIVTVGGSISVFGFVGIYIGFVIINYEELEPFGPMRCCLIIMCILYTVLLTFLTYSLNPFVDNYGHMGAFLVGLVCSFFAIPRMNGSQNKVMTYIGIGIIGGFIVVGLVLIIFVRNFSGPYVSNPPL